MKEFAKLQKLKAGDTVGIVSPSFAAPVPIIQNMDFGHTDPQICLPYGGEARIDSINKKVFVRF